MKSKLMYLLRLVLVAIMVGLAITVYQYVGHLIIHSSNELLQGNIIICVVTILISLVGSIAVIYLNKKIPGYYGSGIPQIEGYHRGTYNFSPIKMLILMFINSFFAFFTAFLLGSEGPSISIGSSIGMIHNRFFDDEDKSVVAIGGSAGFACAFMSPLAGICHLIEENKKLLSYKFLLKGLFVISISFIICYLIYNHSLLPYFSDLSQLKVKYYWLLIPLVLISIGLSKLYVLLIIKMKDLSKKANFMIYLTPFLLVLFMTLRRFHPILVGNGGLLLNLEIIDYGLLIILGILLFRLVSTALSVSSNVSGGIVLPMLVIGALGGNILVDLYSRLDAGISQYLGVFIICGMVVVFAVVTKAPLTAFVLGIKCAPIGSIVIPLIISITITFLYVYIHKYHNVYHQLEKRLVQVE